MFIDLDRFKCINDTLGHAAGDTLLTEIANRLKHCLEGNDVVARVGGDEFVVVSDALEDHDAALQLGCRIRDVLALPITLAATRIQIGASVGIAFASTPEADPDTLLSDADRALYRAKRTGRGRVELNNVTFISAPEPYGRPLR